MYTPNFQSAAPIYHDEDIVFVRRWQQEYLKEKRYEITTTELKEATRLAIENGQLQMRHEVKYPA